MNLENCIQVVNMFDTNFFRMLSEQNENYKQNQNLNKIHLILPKIYIKTKTKKQKWNSIQFCYIQFQHTFSNFFPTHPVFESKPIQLLQSNITFKEFSIKFFKIQDPFKCTPLCHAFHIQVHKTSSSLFHTTKPPKHQILPSSGLLIHIIHENQLRLDSLKAVGKLPSKENIQIDFLKTVSFAFPLPRGFLFGLFHFPFEI